MQRNTPVSYTHLALRAGDRVRQGLHKNVVLLFLALQAQSGVFGRAEVRLRVRQVIICLLQQALRLLLLSAELVQRGGGLLLLGLQTLDQMCIRDSVSS